MSCETLTSSRPRRGAPRIGIAGAGLLGRLLAWTLAHHGHAVSVFDAAPGPAPRFDGHGAAGFTAAGMLSPLAELETAEPALAARGWDSLAHWEALCGAWARRRALPPCFARQGSLMVAHRPDLGAAHRVLNRLACLAQAAAWPQQPQALEATDLHAAEPGLHSSLGPLHAWMLPGEGQIDAVQAMQTLQDDAPGVQWHWHAPVDAVRAGALGLKNETTLRGFDWVFDTRGVGARPEVPVRGVRGELVWLHAPGVGLQRPVRLLHPRHRVYIVPRPGDLVLVGASELESEDRSAMSLRSAVELMAAAHSVLPALAEARIVRLDTNLRPALPDNRPEIHTEAGLVRINGLYRHGWLLAPSLVHEALVRVKLIPDTPSLWPRHA